MLAHYTRGFKSDKLEAQGGVLDKLVRSGVIGDLVTMSRNDTDRELVYNVELTARKWALNSAVECHLHTVEVIGSNPIAPTIFSSTWKLSGFRRGSIPVGLTEWAAAAGGRRMLPRVQYALRCQPWTQAVTASA